MERKLRLLMLATLPLYLGPLLAGLSGMGWSAVPVFIALFALWLVVMKPGTWPRDLAAWNGARVVTAAAQVAVNAVIVVLLFGIGRGIGGVAGFIPNIPTFVPVALSFLSVAASRLVWDPVKGEQMDALLDSALAQISGFNSGAGVRSAAAAGSEDPMLAALLDLPSDADPLLTAEAIETAMQAEGASLRLSMLEDALDRLDPPRLGLREGLVLWATDASRSLDDRPRSAQYTAFIVAGSNPHLLHLFARRGLALLQARPELFNSFPDYSMVGMTVDVSQPEAVQQSLSKLAAALEALTPPEDRNVEED